MTEQGGKDPMLHTVKTKMKEEQNKAEPTGLVYSLQQERISHVRCKHWPWLAVVYRQWDDGLL